MGQLRHREIMWEATEPKARPSAPVPASDTHPTLLSSPGATLTTCASLKGAGTATQASLPPNPIPLWPGVSQGGSDLGSVCSASPILVSPSGARSNLSTVSRTLEKLKPGGRGAGEG